MEFRLNTPGCKMLWASTPEIPEALESMRAKSRCHSPLPFAMSSCARFSPRIAEAAASSDRPSRARTVCYGDKACIWHVCLVCAYWMRKVERYIHVIAYLWHSMCATCICRCIS
ncbi:MAG: hypothetical protein FE78DRAFT_476414 [Acidomyces sp. 'richmondensis']|nr:MAG: hypothetical protein FE78DRAFT_476414 [Acidomyces sp. 'richmondensis']